MRLVPALAAVNVAAEQHHQFEGDGIVKIAQVEADVALHLIQAVNQGIPMDIQLTRGFRKIQTLFKEFFNKIDSFSLSSGGENVFYKDPFLRQIILPIKNKPLVSF